MVKIVINIILSILICFFLISLLSKIYKIICDTTFINKKWIYVVYLYYCSNRDEELVSCMYDVYIDILGSGELCV